MTPVSGPGANRLDHEPAEVIPVTVRAAGVLSIVLGLGFGIGMVIALRHLAREDELPMTPFGFRSFAGGPFEGLPRPAFVALGIALIGSCTLDVVAGLWLARGQRRGARLALATTPLGLAFGIGFALPFLLAGIPIRAALIAAGRHRLR